MIRSRQVSTCSDWCLNITLTYDTSRNSIATETPVKCKGNVDGSVQDCSISSALEMGILQSCTKPSMSLFIQPISWLWDFARFYDNTYCAIMNRVRFRCMINGKQLDILPPVIYRFYVNNTLNLFMLSECISLASEQNNWKGYFISSQVLIFLINSL